MMARSVKPVALAVLSCFATETLGTPPALEYRSLYSYQCAQVVKATLDEAVPDGHASNDFARKKYGSTFSAFAVIPNDAVSFKNIYGNDSGLTKAASERMTTVRRRLNKVVKDVRFATPGDSDPIEFIGKTKSHIVFVWGHNEKGELQLPNGKSIKLAELARNCASAKKLCVFVSCYSRSFIDGESSLGIDTALDHEQAIIFVEELLARLAGKTQLTASDLSLSMVAATEATNKRVARNEKRPVKMAYVLVAGAIVAIVLASITPDDDDDDE